MFSVDNSYVRVARHSTTRDQALEDVGLEEGDQPDHRRARDRMPPHRPEDRPEGMGPLVRIVVAGGAGDHDGLGIDHLAHDAPGGVGRDDQRLVQVELLGGDPLQAAEQRIRRGVGPGEEHSQPAQVGREEGIHEPRSGECQTNNSVGTTVAGEEPESQHLRDDQDRDHQATGGSPDGLAPLRGGQAQDESG